MEKNDGWLGLAAVGMLGMGGSALAYYAMMQGRRPKEMADITNNAEQYIAFSLLCSMVHDRPMATDLAPDMVKSAFVYSNAFLDECKERNRLDLRKHPMDPSRDLPGMMMIERILDLDTHMAQAGFPGMCQHCGDKARYVQRSEDTSGGVITLSYRYDGVFVYTGSALDMKLKAAGVLLDWAARWGIQKDCQSAPPTPEPEQEQETPDSGGGAE